MVALKLEGKVAIVTGGSLGIGAAVAKRLAQEGCSVVVNYSSSPGAAGVVVKHIGDNGGRAIACEANVSSSSAVAAMFDKAEETYGGIDIVVNNAGILKMMRIIDTDDDTFDAAVSINLKGTFNGMREAAKRVRGGGSIINMSSTVPEIKPEKYGAYSATKAAVDAMTPILAKELRGKNITVNAVAPGPVETALFFQDKPQAMIDKMIYMSPFERLGTPEDIAQVVAYLAGPEARWINGQTIKANGGIA